jgi:hypothetical protein
MVDASILQSRLAFFAQAKARLEARRREGRLTDDAAGRIERLGREIDHLRARLRGAEAIPPRPTYPGALPSPQGRAEWDPVGAEYEARLARIKSSAEFAAMTEALACALALEELGEARTMAVPEDARRVAARLEADVATCAHGEYASPRAIGVMRSLAAVACGDGWRGFLVHLFRRPDEPGLVDGVLRIEPGGYPDGFPPRVKDQVGYVLDNLRLGCPELGERLRTLTNDQREALESALGEIARKWSERGRRPSPWTMALEVANALGLSMPEDPRVKRAR